MGKEKIGEMAMLARFTPEQRGLYFINESLREMLKEIKKIRKAMKR